MTSLAGGMVKPAERMITMRMTHGQRYQEACDWHDAQVTIIKAIGILVFIVYIVEGVLKV